MTPDVHDRDALTGAHGRAALPKRFESELLRASQSGTRLSIAIFDIDHFKSINDGFGHKRGDEILVDVVRRLATVVSAADQLFRYGGDEFVLLMPGRSKEQALALATRMIDAVAAAPFTGTPPLSASISLGLATYPEDGADADSLFLRADARLRAVKRTGRGRALAAETEPMANETGDLTRLIERDGQIETVHAFIDLLFAQSGLCTVVGAPGSGRSRFLAEAGDFARMRGLRVVTIQASPALKARALGALREALSDGPAPPLPGGAAALACRLEQLAPANPLLLIVDNLTDLDPESGQVIRQLFASGRLPHLGLICSVESEAGAHSLHLDVPLHRTIHLPALSPTGIRIWLRSFLRDEPPPAFVRWFHSATRGLPGLLERGMAELKGASIIRSEGDRWLVSPTYVDLRLAERLTYGIAPHNLPVAISRFIGRDEELEQIKRRLTAGRLLTLLGPGGVGKTRLACQAGAELLPRFHHGARFVELAPILGADSIPLALAQVLGLTLNDRTPPMEKVVQHLADKQMLLILDNFEHVIEGAHLVAQVLEAAPAVSVLITSRERLHLSGEALLELGGLPLPTEDAAAGSSAAVQLLADRSWLVDINSAPGPSDMAHVVRICRMVQGIPLGLELAAAWSRLLSYEEIANAIGENLDLLAAQQSDLPERHRSLRAVFDYSWQRLSREEQQAYSRLSVFRGGFTPKAAAEVAGASLFMLSALLDKSLLRRTSQGRFEIHEILRQYGLEALGEHAADTRRRHAAFFLNLAETTAPLLEGPEQVKTAGAQAADQPNLLAALQWALDTGAAETALRLSTALWRFWDLRGMESEGRQWLDQVLAAPFTQERTALRARALARAEHITRRQGDLPRAKLYLDECIGIWEELGDRLGRATASEGLAMIAAYTGDPASGQQRCEEAAAVLRSAGDKTNLYRVLNTLGQTLQLQGKLAEATAAWEESLQLVRELQNTYGIAIALNNLSVAATNLRQYEKAVAYLEECLTLVRELRADNLASAVLGNLGMLALIADDLERAGGYLLDALEHARKLESKLFLSITFGNLGLLARRLGDPTLACARHTESLNWGRQAGFRRSIVYYLVGMAGSLVTAGRDLEGARLLGAAEAALEANRLVPDVVYQQEIDFALSTLSARLGSEALADARQSGHAMNLDEAVTYSSSLVVAP